MILIFTLGILLIIIPINTINTLRSDELLTWFNMAKCDHVVGEEQIFNFNNNNKDIVNTRLQKIRTYFNEKGIEADVFQEIMFTMHISYQDKQRRPLRSKALGISPQTNTNT